MDRNEFISILRGTLQETVSDSVVEENVSYYSHYISDEINRGKREEEVMELLGDPRLIARTIIDTTGGGAYRSGSQVYTEAERDSRQRGFYAQENSEGGIDLHYGRLNLNTWYGKLLGIAVIVLIMALIFTVVGGILSVVLPIVVPVLAVVFILRLLTDRQ